MTRTISFEAALNRSILTDQNTIDIAIEKSYDDYPDVGTKNCSSVGSKCKKNTDKLRKEKLRMND